MVAPIIIPNEKIQTLELPIIDLSSANRSSSDVSKLIVKACEEYGFFKVINHGVPQNIIAKIEEESFNFFDKPVSEKQRAGPANPFGYGSKNIGFNGDMGEVEYILLNTNPINISHLSKSISNQPENFSSAVSGYIEAVRRLACEILELVAEGLCVTDKSVFSKLITDIDSDSLFRLNHYPPPPPLLQDQHYFCKDHQFQNHQNNSRIGFGEHSDLQILTILRSNDVDGLQISPQDGVWVPVSSDPTAFFVNVGDVLQAMTNGRFVSVRHRALANSNKSRMSMAYFATPPLNAWITSPPEIVTPNSSLIYRPFTWAEYKKVAYSLRLADSRLHLFKTTKED